MLAIKVEIDSDVSTACSPVHVHNELTREPGRDIRPIRRG